MGLECDYDAGISVPGVVWWSSVEEVRCAVSVYPHLLSPTISNGVGLPWISV